MYSWWDLEYSWKIFKDHWEERKRLKRAAKQDKIGSYENYFDSPYRFSLSELEQMEKDWEKSSFYKKAYLKIFGDAKIKIPALKNTIESRKRREKQKNEPLDPIAERYLLGHVFSLRLASNHPLYDRNHPRHEQYKRAKERYIELGREISNKETEEQ